MYNLLIAIGISIVLFIVGSLVTGTLVAGFIPGSIGLAVTYVILARRSGKKLQALMTRAGKEFQSGRLDTGRKILKEGLAFRKWQFLVDAQIHAQLGSLDYLQRRYKDARVHLEKAEVLSSALGRQWIPQAMLATIDFREKKHADALQRIGKLKKAGGKDSCFWGLYAYLAMESGDKERALSILADAAKKLPDSNSIQGMTTSIQNRKKVKMKAFAPTWYQFFPEQMPRKMGQQQQRPGHSYPQPRR